MKPVTHDFDVITDTPAPRGRQPQRAEQAPQPGAEKPRSLGQGLAPPEDRLRDEPPDEELRTKGQAAE